MKWFITLSFLLVSVHIFSQNRSYRIDTIQVKSEILKENRNIIVYKPLKLSGADSLKILYLIDGEDSSYRYRKIHERFKDSIKDLIVVGIVNSDRRRDLLYINAADKFLSFITTELFPKAEKNYKIKSRILYGHSFGGAFTIYALVNKSTCFDCFIASSPTPIMDLVNKEDYLRIDKESKKRIGFYFSYGSGDLNQVREWALILKRNLTGLPFRNFDWRFEIFEGKDHDNSDIPALINGLK